MVAFDTHLLRSAINAVSKLPIADINGSFALEINGASDADHWQLPDIVIFSGAHGNVESLAFALLGVSSEVSLRHHVVRPASLWLPYPPDLHHTPLLFLD